MQDTPNHSPYRPPVEGQARLQTPVLAPRYPLITRITWIVLGVNWVITLFCWILMLLANLRIGTRGTFFGGDVLFVTLLFWMAILLPISSIAIMIYCRTIDRHTHRAVLRVILAALLFWPYLLAVVIIVRVFTMPWEPRGAMRTPPNAFGGNGGLYLQASVASPAEHEDNTGT